MFGFGKGKKYSAKWFKKASESELKREREKVRLSYSGRMSMAEATRIENLLAMFDNELANRWDPTEWENNPKRNRDPNYRWTDKNRWEKD